MSQKNSTLPLNKPEVFSLWKHQSAALDWSERQRKFIYGFEPGLGKTLTTILQLEKWYSKHNGVFRTIIFCPKSIVIQWEEEILKQLPQARGKVQPLTGKFENRLKQLSKPNIRILITNYETLDTRLAPYLLNAKAGALVLDECHKLKNHKAKRTKKIIQIADKAHYVIGLTGSLILNQLQDCWSQLRILSVPDVGQNFNAWQRRHFVNLLEGAPKTITWSDYQPTEIGRKAINRTISKHVFVAKKSECLDLPPLVRTEVRVQLDDKTQRLYEQMKQEFIASLEVNGKLEICVSELAVTKMLRLSQIANGIFTNEEGEASDIPCPKYEALYDQLEGILNAKEQVIIWTCYVKSYPLIEAIVKKLAVDYSMFIGGQSNKEREQAKKDFTSGKTRVAIANPAAAGTGLDGLQCASYAIYLQRTFNLEHRVQSKARNYRGGSEVHSSVNHIDIISRETIDENILTALEKKQSMSDIITDFVKEHQH